MHVKGTIKLSCRTLSKRSLTNYSITYPPNTLQKAQKYHGHGDMSLVEKLLSQELVSKQKKDMPPKMYARSGKFPLLVCCPNLRSVNTLETMKVERSHAGACKSEKCWHRRRSARWRLGAELRVKAVPGRKREEGHVEDLEDVTSMKN